TSLPFNMQPQEQTKWCWAATSTSISLYYNANSGWTQCKVACKELNRTDCCDNSVPNPCNEDGYLNLALTITGNFVNIINSSVSFEEVQTEIQKGNIVGVRIGWRSGGGHFLAIYGCNSVGSQNFFDVDDPIFGKSTPT